VPQKSVAVRGEPDQGVRRGRGRPPHAGDSGLLRQLGGLRRDGSPLAVLLYEHIGPNILSTGIFAVFHALFGVASGDDGGVTEDTDLHGAHFKTVQRIARCFQFRQSLGLVRRPTVPAHFHPAIGENVPQLVRVPGLLRIHPIVFDLLELIRGNVGRNCGLFCIRGLGFGCASSIPALSAIINSATVSRFISGVSFLVCVDRGLPF
jgi:hypothetical protein